MNKLALFFSSSLAIAAAAVAATGCSRIQSASAVSRPVAPAVAQRTFAPQKYVLQNNFTLLWKSHSDLSNDSGRVDAILKDMATMGAAGSDLITQKFTVAQALSIQASVLAQESGLQAKQGQLTTQQTGLTQQKSDLEAKQAALAAQLTGLQAQIQQLTALRAAETDPDKQKALDEQIAQAQAGVAQIQAGQAQISGGVAQIDNGLAQIADGLTQISAGLEKIAQAKAQINQKLAQAAQSIASDRTEIPAVADDFSEPIGLLLDFDTHGSPEITLQGWAAEGGTPGDYHSLAGHITNVSYEPLGGVFKFTIPLSGGVSYAFTLSRARYELEAQGIVAFHADIVRSERGQKDRNGIGKFMGVLAAPAK